MLGLRHADLREGQTAKRAFVKVTAKFELKILTGKTHFHLKANIGKKAYSICNLLRL